MVGFSLGGNYLVKETCLYVHIFYDKIFIFF